MTANIISLGGGVQSTVLVLMALESIIPCDEIIFCDLGNELPETYENINRLQALCEGKIEFTILHTCNIIEHVRNQYDSQRPSGHFVAIPVFATNTTTGQRSQLRRQCTHRWKIAPVRRHLRERYKKCRLGLGISIDEASRMRDSDVRWCQNWYPLIDISMSRRDCIEFLKQRNYPVPARSSCIICPYRSIKSWQGIAKRHPALFDEACKVDELIRIPKREMKRPTKFWLNYKCMPLRDLVQLQLQLQFDDDETGEQSECTGFCWT